MQMFLKKLPELAFTWRVIHNLLLWGKHLNEYLTKEVMCDTLTPQYRLESR